MKYHTNPDATTVIATIMECGVSFDLNDESTWVMGLFMYPEGEIIEVLGTIEDSVAGTVLFEVPERGLEQGLKIQAYLYVDNREVYTDPWLIEF